MTNARRFIDAPTDERCQANVVLHDKSSAQCGRRREEGNAEFCWQHARRPRPVCGGCAVRAPWEHRCHGGPCPCTECKEGE